MAKKNMGKTKMRSNKSKKENENSRRFTRTSETTPNSDGFRSNLLVGSRKRTSPRSTKMVIPQKAKSGSAKEPAKKKAKMKKSPMTPSASSQSSSPSNIVTTPTKTNKAKSSTAANNDKSSTAANNDKSSTAANNNKSSTAANNDKSSTAANNNKSSSVSVNSPTSKNNKPVKKAYVVFVGNLPYSVTKEQLEEHFRKTGGVKIIRIPKEKGTDKGRGFAYIEFKDRISHKIGLRLHHTHLGGRQINVEFTSIGGKNAKRLEKLKQKNLKLTKMKKDYYAS